ncbi:MAG: hypothetical protein KC656_17815 [Myxococcales bacterium]|nr:hypothetical protein [Myxococcales bacterium]MCB9694234.1 hypothetical protein [Alphaproteobacteria bacterium]
MLLLVAAALADAVPSPPDDCPPGSVGTTGHSGAYCTPEPTCQATCEAADEQCLPVGLCILEATRPCGGMQDPEAPPCTYLHREAFGTCTTQDECSEGTCTTEDRCVTPEEVGTPACGCASRPSPLWLAPLALLPLAARRRRSE